MLNDCWKKIRYKNWINTTAYLDTFDHNIFKSYQTRKEKITQESLAGTLL